MTICFHLRKWQLKLRFVVGEEDEMYLEEEISRPTKRFNSPISYFIKKRRWNMMLLQIYCRISFISLPWLQKSKQISTKLHKYTQKSTKNNTIYEIYIEHTLKQFHFHSEPSSLVILLGSTPQ